MNARLISASGAIVLASLLAACSAGGGSGSAQSTADSITKAAYNNDTDGVTANFDDNLKRQVTRASLGALSDQLHKRGDYTSLTLLSKNPSRNEFMYRANFTNGSANIVLRLDPDGKVSAYRVFPLN